IFDDVVTASGLREVLDRFRGAGAGEQVDSWLSRGENQPLQRDQVERAIDPETLEELARQTGLSKEDLIERITRDLPEAVDKMTPTAELPSESDKTRGPNLLDDVPPAGTRS